MASTKKLTPPTSSVELSTTPAKDPTQHLASFHVTSDQVQQLLDILQLGVSSTEAVSIGEKEKKGKKERR